MAAANSKGLVVRLGLVLTLFPVTLAVAQNPGPAVICLTSDLSALQTTVYVDAGRSIEDGISQCQGKPNCGVLVAAARFELKQSLHIPDAVHLYGGCAEKSVQTDATATLIVGPPGGLPVAIFDSTQDAHTGLDGFVLLGTDTPRGEKSSRATAVIYGRHSTFTLSNDRLEPGAGGDGADGRPGLLHGPTNQQCGGNGKLPAAIMDEFVLHDVPWTTSSSPWSILGPQAAAPGRSIGNLQGGGGGENGSPGGASLGMLLIQSRVRLSRLVFVKGRSGHGGAGGAGGAGAYADAPEPVEAGAGGAGAGGDAGPTYNIVADGFSNVVFADPAKYTQDGFVMLQFPSAGTGGLRSSPKTFTCPDNKAPDGRESSSGPLFRFVAHYSTHS